jgi:hypothetical protein
MALSINGEVSIPSLKLVDTFERVGEGEVRLAWEREASALPDLGLTIGVAWEW